MSKDIESRLRVGKKGGVPDAMYTKLQERAESDQLIDVAFTTVDSPLGKLLAAKTKRGLIRLSYEGGNPDASLEHLAVTVSPRIFEVPARLDDVRRELDEYFEGRRNRFDIPIDWSFAAGFSQRVLKATNRIPFGSVSSYAQIAFKAGSPRASRAAGNASRIEPDADHRSLSQGAEERGSARRLHGWPAPQGVSAGVGGRPLSSCLWRPPLRAIRSSADMSTHEHPYGAWLFRCGQNMSSLSARCARIARRQFGVVTRAQALEIGLTRRMIGRAIERGELTVLYPSAYLVAGAPRSWHARLLGAVIAGGPKTAASHRAAAYLMKLDGFEQQIVEITSPRNIRWDKVVAHRGPELFQHEIRKVNGIPTATINHTLIALGAVVSPERLEGALDSALLKGLTSTDYLGRRLERSGPLKSCAVLKALLRERTGRRPTESELERLYHRKVTLAFSLPTPICGFRLEGAKRRIDFAYPHIGLGVELLGWKVHGAYTRWNRDLDRHNELTNLGWQMLYFPWTTVKKYPERVAGQVLEAIQLRTPSLLNK